MFHWLHTVAVWIIYAQKLLDFSNFPISKDCEFDPGMLNALLGLNFMWPTFVLPYPLTCKQDNYPLQGDGNLS